MQLITEKIEKNNYFVQIGREIRFTIVSNLLKEIKFEKNICYLHILIQYFQWSKNLDLFQYLGKKNIRRLQKKRIMLLIDLSTEGWSPINQVPIFDCFYNSCHIYNISPKQIIYVTSNLLDENNIEIYCSKNKTQESLNVLSFTAFEFIFNREYNKTTEEILEYNIKQTKKNFTTKYFSSLSRMNRNHRQIANFLLFNSSVFHKGLISHNRLEKNDSIQSFLVRSNLGTNDQVKNWAKSLPFIVDRSDFNVNWALKPFLNIYHQTLFHIVNETEVENYKNTALFYSEKTYRPIYSMTPFIIYGQKGCNNYLEKLGYKLYHDWFDYSFDDIDDRIERFEAILKQVETLCLTIDLMSEDEKIQWKFKNTEVLIHNYNNLFKNTYSREKFTNFFKNL
jgi:hypothetical protein